MQTRSKRTQPTLTNAYDPLGSPLPASLSPLVSRFPLPAKKLFNARHTARTSSAVSTSRVSAITSAITG